MARRARHTDQDVQRQLELELSKFASSIGWWKVEVRQAEDVVRDRLVWTLGLALHDGRSLPVEAHVRTWELVDAGDPVAFIRGQLEHAIMQATQEVIEGVRIPTREKNPNAQRWAEVARLVAANDRRGALRLVEDTLVELLDAAQTHGDACATPLGEWHVLPEQAQAWADATCPGTPNTRARVPSSLWTDVRVYVPAQHDPVLVLINDGRRELARFDDGQWWVDDRRPASVVTHWRPLPPAPDVSRSDEVEAIVGADGEIAYRHHRGPEALVLEPGQRVELMQDGTAIGYANGVADGAPLSVSGLDSLRDMIERQLFLQTATGDELDRIAEQLGIPRATEADARTDAELRALILGQVPQPPPESIEK